MVVQMVKNLSAMQETRVPPLSQEEPPEKGMATHSSTVAGESHLLLDRGAWQAVVHGVARVGHDLATELPPWFVYSIVP